MKTTIELEIEIEIDFDATKEERMTRHYPGSPACVEINSMLIGDKELSMESFNLIMAVHQDDIEQACWDEVAENAAERAMADAEYRRDAMENR